MTAYASGTQVPASRSRDEIERTLKRFGAKNIAFASLSQVIVVAFTFEELTIRVQVPLPVASDDVFVFASVNKTAKRRRTPKQAEEAWQREVNPLWRALAAVIKAKLVTPPRPEGRGFLGLPWGGFGCIVHATLLSARPAPIGAGATCFTGAPTAFRP